MIKSGRHAIAADAVRVQMIGIELQFRDKKVAPKRQAVMQQMAILRLAKLTHPNIIIAVLLLALGFVGLFLNPVGVNALHGQTLLPLARDEPV